ncbi:hypothetical protein ElyMa_000825100 [Elysia marginata]|uniref:Uncharacterized protein n=1 Tax=Elysia marginata TaxID=1093978 RepID=A0AAV4H1M3_9GAST|nr:hypothetical protein ElyMa_000825100 [Elysia marginata]
MCSIATPVLFTKYESSPDKVVIIDDQSKIDVTCSIATPVLFTKYESSPEKVVIIDDQTKIDPQLKNRASLKVPSARLNE